MSEHILVSQQDSILKIQFNRPEKKNAITAAMYSTMADAIAQAEADADIRAIYITGSEDSFTSGNDLNDFLQNPPREAESPVFRFLRGISTAEKPIVAAVNGLAIGIGTTLLLHCDLAYAADTAKFQMPFVNLALVPEAASSYLIPAMMGQRKAAELLLLGDAFSAAKAAELGVINEATSADALEGLAWSKAQALAQKAPEALRLSKMLLKKGNAQVIAKTMAEEGQLFGERLQSPEAMEVMQAFMERREPDFSKFS